jgi:hypothetical protein
LYTLDRVYNNLTIYVDCLKVMFVGLMFLKQTYATEMYNLYYIGIFLFNSYT